jgi:tRNA(Met) C34 N-acetyltransferase TmcA
LTAYQLGITGRRHSILFANGSRVYAFPHRAHSVLGVTADHLIVDEAARVDQKVLAAILPSLARTNGSIWLLSTPACQTGVFYDIWHADNEDKWYKVKATIEDTRYATPEFIADVQSLMPEREFRQDFYCEFHALQGALFTREMVDKLFTYDGDNWVLPPLNKEVGWK